MIVGLIIILVFPFIYFYTQMNNFNEKTSAIRQAINEGSETYIDPLTGKTHWTENGEQVIWTEILPVERNIPEGCIVGDKVLRGVKSGKVYKNKSYERFVAHVQRQIDNGEVWCWEREAYGDKDGTLRYHMKDKYFYHLYHTEKRISEEIKLPKSVSWKPDRYMLKFYTEHNCILRKYLDYKNNKYQDIKITYEEYKKLGGD